MVILGREISVEQGVRGLEGSGSEEVVEATLAS